MKKLSVLAVCVALIGATSAVKAVEITGTVSFAGNASFDNVSSGSATEVTAWINSIILSDTGTFASYVTPFSTPSTLSAPWTFNNSAGLPNLVSFGGFTFNLGSSAIVSQTASSGASANVAVSGVGVVTGNGFDSTVFSWSFSANGQESGSPLADSFSANLTALPDGGLTVALLGGALTTLGLVRRKLVA